MLSTLVTGLHRAILAAVYDPGSGADLPGKAGTGMHTIMDWAAGIGLGLGVISIIGAGVMLGMSYFGHGSPKLGAIGWACAGVALVSSAASIVTALA